MKRVAELKELVKGLFRLALLIGFAYLVTQYIHYTIVDFTAKNGYDVLLIALVVICSFGAGIAFENRSNSDEKSKSDPY